MFLPKERSDQFKKSCVTTILLSPPLAYCSVFFAFQSSLRIRTGQSDGQFRGLKREKYYSRERG